MCFRDTDPVLDTKRSASQDSFLKMKLKRRRSPPTEETAEAQESRKLSKLDSAASTIVNVQHSPPETLMSIEEQPELDPVVPAIDADKESLRIEQLQSRNAREPTSVTAESTLTSSLTHCTSLVHRAALIEAHNAAADLRSYISQHLTSFESYPALRFELKRPSKMTSDELEACFLLIKKTSAHDYQSSSIGWNEDNKFHEMNDKEMMYLLVLQAEGYIGFEKAKSVKKRGAKQARAVVGFLSFKLEPEDEEQHMMRPVAYIYEIHLEDWLRGHGLGMQMLKWAESQARLVNISKVMLTVFRVNEDARRLYERVGYVTDKLSPADRPLRKKVFKSDYLIMSKEL